MQIEEYIQSVLGTGIFEDCYLVDIIEKENRLKIYFDGDSGVSLGRCQKLSRLVEAFVEENNLLPEDYKLDVSSPGLDRPLKFRRQYEKNKGRRLSVATEIEKIEGELKEITDKGITLMVKKSKKLIEEQEVLWEDIKLCKVVPTF